MPPADEKTLNQRVAQAMKKQVIHKPSPHHPWRRSSTPQPVAAR
jgi:hypothetical protein